MILDYLVLVVSLYNLCVADTLVLDKSILKGCSPATY